MRQLRSIRFRSYVLPLLLAALVLQFLIPTGFMPAGEGTTLTVAMCATEQGKSETLEIPGESAKPHCDQCTTPSMGAPLAPFNFAGPTQVPQRSLLPLLESQLSEAPLLRAQLARAPPNV
ncbi:MAG TPA: hypothetical protein VFS58_17080 [Steroidobacteraceae bacterium]|nr:hypothetical protein [Steroidobacteraceae bacterium]